MANIPYVDNIELPRITLRQVACCTLPAGGWQLRRAVNIRWTFYVNDRNGAWIRSRRSGRRLEMPAGRMILIPARASFDAGTDVELTHLFGYFEISADETAERYLPTEPMVTPEDALDGIFPRLHDGPPGITQKLQLVARLHVGLAATLGASSSDNRDLLYRRLEPALTLIRHSSQRQISQEELAVLCGLSTQTFARQFHALTGTTAVQALRRRRVEKAAGLLADTDQDLDTIARTCGLANRPYLIRVFRAVLGTTPGDYRRGVRQLP